MQNERYYVWTDDGSCDNCTDSLAEAKQWADEFEIEGRESYVTNADSMVVYVGMNPAMKMGCAIRQAADLYGDSVNPEYLRGMCELMARCFPEKDVYTDERADWFEDKVQAQIEKDA